MRKWTGILDVRYTVEAETREEAKALMDGIAESTRRSGVTSRSSAQGSAKMKRSTAKVVSA